MVALGDWYVQPRLTVAAIYRGISGYQESGGTPFDLLVHASSDVVATANPMLQVGRVASIPGTGTLRGFVGFGAGLAVNNDWVGKAAFALEPADTFSARTRLPDAVGKVEAGLDFFTAGGLQAKLSYSVSLAPGYTSNSFTGRLAYAF